MCRHTPVPITLFHFASMSLNSTSSWFSAWYIETPREYRHTFESLFPPQGLSLSVHFILTSDVAGLEIERNLRFLYSSHMYHLTCVNSWDSEHEERTIDIFLRMIEVQMTPGSLCHQGSNLKDLCNSRYITGTDATTSDLLVSLNLPRQVPLQGIYINSTWLGRAWHTDWPRAGGHARCTSQDHLQFSGILPWYYDHHTSD